MDGRGVACALRGARADRRLGRLGQAVEGTGNVRLKVALVTDIGGLNDKSFNALAYKGLKNAEKKLGVEGRVFLSKSSADYIPNLSTGARGYDLVIGVGFLMADQMAAVAKRFPDTKFAIVDYPAAALKGAPKNVRGILFAEQEAGCLAGVAAATVSKSGVIASVGGLKIPPVDAYIAGYQYCAKKVKPGIKTLNDYSQDFVDQDEVQGDRAQPDRPEVRRRVPGRRRLRPRRDPGREGQQGLGHRRRRRPGATSASTS